MSENILYQKNQQPNRLTKLANATQLTEFLLNVPGGYNKDVKIRN